MFIKSETIPEGYILPPPRLLSSGRATVTSEQRIAMKDLYENHGLSTWKIGKAMGYLNVCVIKNLKKAGVKMRNRSDANKTIEVNRTYFDSIDTPTKAYVLGFLYADGNLSKDSFTIALQERDKYILESMAKEIGYTGGLSFRKKQATNKQNMWALRVHDATFAESLRGVGIVPQKTSKVRFPTFLDKSLTWAFIHGLSDGDGCVYCVNNAIRFVLAGAEMMVKDIQDILSKEDINMIFRTVPDSNGTIGCLNGINAVKFLSRIYQSGSRLHLTRKRQRFVDFLRFKSEFARKKYGHKWITPYQFYLDILQDLNEASHTITDQSSVA